MFSVLTVTGYKQVSTVTRYTTEYEKYGKRILLCVVSQGKGKSRCCNHVTKHGSSYILKGSSASYTR